MIRKWPGQTKEEWIEEWKRDRALTPEQRQQEQDEFFAKIDKEIEDRRARKIKEEEERYKREDKRLYIHAEKPNSLDMGEATVSWLIIMIVGAIFKERWFVWIVATIIYICYLNKYEIREWRWENGGKEKYYQNIKDACKGDKKDE